MDRFLSPRYGRYVHDVASPVIVAGHATHYLDVSDLPYARQGRLGVLSGKGHPDGRATCGEAVSSKAATAGPSIITCESRQNNEGERPRHPQWGASGKRTLC